MTTYNTGYKHLELMSFGMRTELSCENGSVVNVI